ncbi:DUF1800 domain-containing protein [Ramlibacter alkalitolerans]|uniref:DUF1800 domain-containing protein n=1 Tax=Ramlibacter alkalitolerans TaxID=2039631 RepID=A0ABS1JS49_9BURK|nr:DUF1800 domain-containing protein [Ramlibacter alkalitolerans]MBL0427067.1 DUF1800 domain-containing protein [Ramlibacter alkalitolerans]
MLTRRATLLHAAASAATAAIAWPARAAAGPRTGAAAAAHALNRLGYGPRPGDLARLSADPMAWVDEQLQPARQPLPATLTARLREDRFLAVDPTALMQGYLAVARHVHEIGRARAAGLPTPGYELRPDRQGTPESGELGRYIVALQVPAFESRIYRALESPRQLEEAMVDFWFNHFNVHESKGHARVLIGHYEQYAIRPYALGRFADLLHATARHPAMLSYLDNARSVAPGRGARGMNENYARELMELHTLGVDGGYTQQDVTELARILTGWTFTPVYPDQAPAAGPVAMPGEPRRMPGFLFNARTHDAGTKTWLGHRIAAQGEAEGDFALDTLARHPATARHIAFKLAQYFVSDAPPPALVDTLARVFLAQDGQVVPVLRALFASDAFWEERQRGAKFKTPLQFTLATLRALGHTPPNVRPLKFELLTEGMPLFQCATPDGYKNTEAAWLSPHVLGRRVEYATRVTNNWLGRVPLDVDRLLADLGPLVTPATAQAVAGHREEPQLAVALVLASPGMMRR